MDLRQLINSQLVLNAAFLPGLRPPQPHRVVTRVKEGASLVELAAMVVADNVELYEDRWVPLPLRALLQKYMDPGTQRHMFNGTRAPALTCEALWPTVKKYLPDGSPKSNKEYDEEGKLHGKREKWYDNGKKCREECYEHGALSGEARWWHETGRLWTHQNFLNGRRHGECVWYYPNGTIHRIVHYQFGLRDGHFATFYPNGAKCEEGQYQDDKEVGQWRKWSRMGHYLGASEPSTFGFPVPK